MWKQIGIIGLGLGASIAVNVGIQHAVKKALSHQRKKSIAKQVNVPEEDKDFELIANCELVELHQRGGRVKLRSAVEDRRRIFTICNLPNEEGGRRQVVLMFKGVDKDEDLDFRNLDGDFSPKYHNCALTPDHMTIKKMERVQGETPEEDRERFEIIIPGTVGKNRYIIKINHLEDSDQRKLVEWLDARSVGFISENEEEEEEEEEEETEGKKGLKEKIKEGANYVQAKISEKDQEIKQNLDKIATGGSGTTKPNTSTGESWHNNTPTGLTSTTTGSGLHTNTIINPGGSAYNPVGNTLNTNTTTSGSGYLQVQEGAQVGGSAISQGAQTAVEGVQQGTQGVKEGLKQAVTGVTEGINKAMEGMKVGAGGSSSLPIGNLDNLKK